ncbi:MAG: hypothetical protein R3D44_13140 [Hyphomicrobiaceae bacterium]
MLKSFVNGLRRAGVLSRHPREVLIILNHNPSDAKEPGDVDFFASVEDLVRDLRAIDLNEGGYLALDTTGRLIAMRPLGNDPDALIEATLARHPSEAQLAQRMLKHYLLGEIDDEGEAPEKKRHLIEREHDTKRLIEMLPEHIAFA